MPAPVRMRTTPAAWPWRIRKRRRAARAVARDLGRAAVGIVELDGAIGVGIRGPGRPASSHRRRRRCGGRRWRGRCAAQVAFRRVVLPGEQKIVLGAVRFGERDLHSCSAFDFHGGAVGQHFGDALHDLGGIVARADDGVGAQSAACWIIRSKASCAGLLAKLAEERDVAADDGLQAGADACPRWSASAPRFPAPRRSCA